MSTDVETTSVVGDIGTAPRPLTPINEKDTGLEITMDAGMPAVTKHTINFHRDSDMIVKLKTKSGTVTFKVNSCNVAAASPVWRAIFYGKGALDRPEEDEWVIELDDEPNALETLFRVVHYDFIHVPTEVTVDDVYNIAMLTSKYECAHLVSPWAAGWIDLMQRLLDLGAVDVNAVNYKIAWVAWEFGHARLLQKMAESLINTCKVDSDGDLVTAVGVKLQDLILPPQFADHIYRVRSETLKNLLLAIKEPIQHLAHIKRQDEPKYCRTGGDDQDMCERMMLGSAMATLVKAGLFPVPDVKDYKGSVLDLQVAVMSIEYHPWEGKNYAPHKSHVKCSMRLDSSFRKIFNTFCNPLGTEYDERINVQSAISGISNAKYHEVASSSLSPTDPDFLQSQTTGSGSGNKLNSGSERSPSPKSITSSGTGQARTDPYDHRSVSEASRGSSTAEKHHPVQSENLDKSDDMDHSEQLGQPQA